MRPPLPVGTWGDVTTHPTRSGRWEARARFRDHDGRTRQVRRTATTPRAAKAALTTALRDRGRTHGQDLTADSTLTAAATMWRPTLEGKASATRTAYTRALDRDLLPAMGGRRLREITTQTVEQTITTLTNRRGASTARIARGVLTQVLAMAVRLDAIDHNPATASTPVRTRKTQARALTPAQVATVRDAVRTYQSRPMSQADILDVIDMQLATGMRIGEALALRWQDVDLATPTVTVTGTVAMTDTTPHRPFRQDHPKTTTSRRTIPLPRFGVEVLMRRQVELPASTSGLVFPSARDTARDPGSVRKSLARALDGTGLEWVTTHTFRRTVATVIRDPEVAAQVLGHDGQGVIDRYIERTPTVPDVTALLDAFSQSGA